MSTKWEDDPKGNQKILQDLMSERHTHAELVEPREIVYKEEAVFEIAIAYSEDCKKTPKKEEEKDLPGWQIVLLLIFLIAIVVIFGCIYWSIFTAEWKLSSRIMFAAVLTAVIGGFLIYHIDAFEKEKK